MEKDDKTFLLALAYTTSTEKNIDPAAFLQKVEDNQNTFSELLGSRKPPKLHTTDHRKLGL